MSGPTAYLHDNPNPNTPTLAGEPINMRLLADEEGFDYSYLSHIFRGDRLPNPKYARRLADALGMTLSDLYAALDAKHSPAKN